MLRQEDIDSVKSSVNMPMVAAHYGIQVSKKGFALCPFHQDRRPSMRIYSGYLNNDGFHCFSCGEGGSIVKFIMEYENLSYEEAIRHLAAIFNIRIADGGNINFQERKKICHEKYIQKLRILLSQNEWKEVNDLAMQINLMEDILRYCEPYGQTFCLLDNLLPKMKADWQEKYTFICNFKNQIPEAYDVSILHERYQLSEIIKDGNKKTIVYLKSLLCKEQEECQKRRKST